MRGVGNLETRKGIDRKALFSVALPAGTTVRYKVLKRLFAPWWPRYQAGEAAMGHRQPVYLTFDDGPHPETTLKIAEMLEQGGHFGTFFFVGQQALRYPAIVRSLDAAGHSIGSHSSVHLDWRTASLKERFRDYVKGHRQVEEVLGHSCAYFRPPHSRFDLCSLIAAAFLRTQFVLYSSDSLDWQEKSAADQAYENVLSTLSPGGIALFHDNIIDNPFAADRSHTVTAVEQLLQTFERSGWKGKAL